MREAKQVQVQEMEITGKARGEGCLEKGIKKKQAQDTTGRLVAANRAAYSPKDILCWTVGKPTGWYFTVA